MARRRKELAVEDQVYLFSTPRLDDDYYVAATEEAIIKKAQQDLNATPYRDEAYVYKLIKIVKKPERPMIIEPVSF